MHLVNSTTTWLKRILVLSFALFFYSNVNAQENSPYSRYGLGDVVPNQNIANRGMGGVSIADTSIFNINFKNPAYLGNLSNRRNRTSLIFDIGGEIDVRTLKNSTSTYTATNTLMTYLQVAFPIASKKMEKKGIGWGLSFGLRPVTRINYKIEKNERLPGIDSLNTLYEGSGGVNQFNLSTGVKYRQFSMGISTGYTFGTKDYATQLVFVNDTVPYIKSNTQTQSHFGGIFLNIGAQYQFHMKGGGALNVGAYTNLQQNLKADQDKINETFNFDGAGGITSFDSVKYEKDVKGIVVMPATYGIGFNYHNANGHWTLGADFEFTNWMKYSYYEQRDDVQDSWTVRLGAEYYPAKNNTPFSKYWHFVKYRAGFYVGPDYVKLDKSLINYAATVGASFPLTSFRLLLNNSDENQFVLLHTTIEYGGRADKSTASFTEKTWRFGIGLSMNAKWFQKRSYY